MKQQQKILTTTIPTTTTLMAMLQCCHRRTTTTSRRRCGQQVSRHPRESSTLQRYGSINLSNQIWPAPVLVKTAGVFCYPVHPLLRKLSLKIIFLKAICFKEPLV
jgi:hypothetical protein